MGKVKAMFQEYGSIEKIPSAGIGSSQKSVIQNKKENPHESESNRYYSSNSNNEER